MKKIARLFAAALLAAILFIAFANARIILFARQFVYSDIKDVPPRYTAIVLGARAYQNGAVSHVFRDRIDGAMDLLEHGSVQKILVSGDHGRRAYDEVNSALSYIRQTRRFDEADVFLDHAGFSTYETMFRARDVFRVREAAVVTQRFHIYRSVYIARKLGLDAVGFVPAEKNPFSKRTKISWELRECLARPKAFLSVALKARPRFLGQEIPITGDGRATRG